MMEKPEGNYLCKESAGQYGRQVVAIIVSQVACTMYELSTYNIVLDVLGYTDVIIREQVDVSITGFVSALLRSHNCVPSFHTGIDRDWPNERLQDDYHSKPIIQRGKAGLFGLGCIALELLGQYELAKDARIDHMAGRVTQAVDEIGVPPEAPSGRLINFLLRCTAHNARIRPTLEDTVKTLASYVGDWGDQVDARYVLDKMISYCPEIEIWLREAPALSAAVELALARTFEAAQDEPQVPEPGDPPADPQVILQEHELDGLAEGGQDSHPAVAQEIPQEAEPKDPADGPPNGLKNKLDF
jgi:hypothetical protein